jgi:hypothetical protein
VTIILSSLINLGCWELFSRHLPKRRNLTNDSAWNWLIAAAVNDWCDWSIRLIMFRWDVVIAIVSFAIMIHLKCNLVSTSFRWVRQQLGSTSTRAEFALDLLINGYHANPVKVINWCYNLLYVIIQLFSGKFFFYFFIMWSFNFNH